jgi:hypothetical protein
MAKHEQEDFVWVRPRPDYGSVSITAGGRLNCSATREAPACLTRAEWETVFRHYEALELTEAPNLNPPAAVISQTKK